MPFLMSDFYEGKYGGQTMEANIAGKKAETAYREAQTGIIPLDRQLKELELKQGQQKLDMQKQMQDRLANLKVGESTAGTDLPSQIAQANQSYQQNMQLSQLAGAGGMPEEALRYGTLAKQNQGEANTLLKQYNEEKASLLAVAKINPDSWQDVKAQFIKQYPKEAAEIAKMAEQQGIDMNNWNDPRVQAVVDQQILRAGGAAKMLDLYQKNADRDEARQNRKEESRERESRIAVNNGIVARQRRDRLEFDKAKHTTATLLEAEKRDKADFDDYNKTNQIIDAAYNRQIGSLQENAKSKLLSPESVRQQQVEALLNKQLTILENVKAHIGRGLPSTPKVLKEKAALESQIKSLQKKVMGQGTPTGSSIPKTWEDAKKDGWK